MIQQLSDLLNTGMPVLTADQPFMSKKERDLWPDLADGFPGADEMGKKLNDRHYAKFSPTRGNKQPNSAIGRRRCSPFYRLTDNFASYGIKARTRG